MKLRRKPKFKGTAWRLEGHKPAKPVDNRRCLRATLRRALRQQLKAMQPGPNPTPGPNRAFRRGWQPAPGLVGSPLLRIRHGRLERRG